MSQLRNDISSCGRPLSGHSPLHLASDTACTLLACVVSHLDCQGVMTPSSGPPMSTNCSKVRKFFL